MAIGEEDRAVVGLQEASKARLQAQVRAVQDRITHTEAFGTRSKKKLETLNAEASRIQEELAQVFSQNSRWRTSAGGFEGGSYCTAKSIQHAARSSGGDSSVAMEPRRVHRRDCARGFASQCSVQQLRLQPPLCGEETRTPA